MMPPDQIPSAGTVLQRLDEHVLTMAEILEAAGYRTAAVSPNPWIRPEFGYAQGFESFTVDLLAPAEQITTKGLAAVEQLRAGGVPFFLYLHYLDPHAPYKPPKGHDIYQGGLPPTRFPAPMAKDVDHYDGEIHSLDASLGRLFAGLAAEGVYDDLVIVLLGDHGEQFGEHGNKGHGWQLFNEELHVPLVVKPGRMEAKGGQTGRSIHEVVSIIDVLPTVLALVDVTPPAGLPGVNLLDGEALAARRGVFAEIDRRLSLRGFVGANGKKLVLDREGEKFDPADPLENVVGVFDWNTPERTPIEDADLLRELEDELVAVLKRVESQKITPRR
jgi:arylsulfatase A-like enzyme